MNNFLKTLLGRPTTTENGAISHSTSGSAVLDYFTKSATARNRELNEVFADLAAAWAENPELTLKVIFYNRMITRKVNGFVATEKVQKGQGNRSEFRSALRFLAERHPAALSANLHLVPSVGSWKDLWHAETVTALNHQEVFELIAAGLTNDYHRELLAKYVPRIRSRSNTHNDRHRALNQFAFGLIKFLGWTPVQYRHFKSSGLAHEFQRQMAAGKWDELDFKTIPGRALFTLVNGKGRDDQLTTLQRHGIEARYVDWIKSQPVAKFTGYVYELMRQVGYQASTAQRLTVDKQFDGLIALARQDGDVTENVWCALDTSGSMGTRVADTTAFDICISLGIYFSTLNQGAFRDHVIMFDNDSRVKQLSGTFSDKVTQLRKATTAWGSTNFQSVIDEIVRVRLESPGVPISDFPTTLLVVSDMQFNPVSGNTATNYETAMRKLRAVGLPDIRIVWWHVTDRTKDFPAKMDDQGVVLIGGFDGAIISSLLGKDESVANTNERADGGFSTIKAAPTPYESMVKVLDQEVLNLVAVG
ncbi:DUF2828 family protein [Lewinella sp. 4G2]|uniref:DUF2828 family protein n=1 Tax=Lewinella sp. 4G2 TaxID=1803372 RepID=UPI0007B48804|nr:DUF2828 family protein [Lewinella sp. 4G2]OAV42722.1 hypothetical protein A3850_015900 [Lewinella sp. 4G2]